MYPLLRMKDLSGIVVILLFFSATGCFIQESYGKGNSCSIDDEIYKNNSDIVFGKACPLENGAASKLKESTSKLKQQWVISDREILYGDVTTTKTDEPSPKSSYYGCIKSSDIRKDIRSTRDVNQRTSRGRNRRDKQEINISTERRTLSRSRREADSTSIDSVRISTSKTFAIRMVNPGGIAVGNGRRSARFFPSSDLDIRNLNVALRSQSFKRGMQPSHSLGKPMVIKEHQGRHYRFGHDRRQRENHEKIEKSDNMLTKRDSTERQTWKQTDVTPESKIGISSSRTFANRRINSRTSGIRNVRVVNKVSDVRLFPNTDNFDIRHRIITNFIKQVFERDIQPARFLETHMVNDKRAERLYRFGNDRRQRENNRVFERNNNVLTNRDSATQTQRVADITPEDTVEIAFSRSFSTRRSNSRSPTLDTIRTRDERTVSRFISSRNALNSRSKNVLPTLRQSVERDMLQARRLEKRMLTDQRAGRLHRFGNDRRQREKREVFERNNNLLTIRDSTTETERETDITPEDPMRIYTSRSFDTKRSNPKTTSRFITSRNILNSRNQHLLPTMRQSVGRDMQEAHHLERLMVANQRVGRLNRFGNDRRQTKNRRAFERNNNPLTIRDSRIQTEREAVITREDRMRITTSRRSNSRTPPLHTIRIGNELTTSRYISSRNNSRSQNLIPTLRHRVERYIQQNPIVEKRMVIDKRGGRIHQFGNDRRQLEKNTGFRESDKVLYIREEHLGPNSEKSKQRDYLQLFNMNIRDQKTIRIGTSRFVRQNIHIVAVSSSDIRTHAQLSHANSYFFGDSVRGNSPQHRAATSVISNENQRTSGAAARNIRSNSYRSIQSRLSESNDYHENLPARRRINGLKSIAEDKTRGASFVDGRAMSSSISQPSHSRQESPEMYRQNNYRSSRNSHEINVLTDSTDEIDTRKFRMKSEFHERLDTSKYSRGRSSSNVENTDMTDLMGSRNLSRERSRNTILSIGRQRNTLKAFELSNDDQELFPRGSKFNRQLNVGDDIREIARNFRQRKNPDSSRNTRDSVFNVQYISGRNRNINKNLSDYDKPSTGPWFGVIQISFAAIVLGQLIFSDEKNSNRIFSANVFRKLKSS